MEKAIKENAYTIRGIAILIILLCHTQITISKYFPADLAVSIFFFLSGYFIMNNYLTKENYLNKDFLIRKIHNIYIPFVISNIIYIIINIIIKNNCFNNILNLILKIIGIIPANGYLWFIPHVLIYYIVYYIFYHKNNNLTIRYYIIVFLIYLSIVIGLFSLLKVWGGYVLFEHLLLVVGGIYSLINNKSNKKLFNIKEKVLFCSIFIILFILNFYYKFIIIKLILQIMAPFFLLTIIKYNKELDFIGKNSLLLYLYHIPIIIILNQLIKNNELIYVVLYLLINLILISIWNIIKNEVVPYCLEKKLIKLKNL